MNKQDRLSPEEFSRQVFLRDHGKCVVCEQKGLVAHQIMDGRLFEDGGLNIDNGVVLCGTDREEALQTTISPKELRHCAGIENELLPEHLVAGPRWTRFGDEELKDGTRSPGELFYEEDVQNILRKTGLLSIYRIHSRFPRTYHLPWSEGKGDDDKTLSNDHALVGTSVVVTEKMDGEATSIYADGYVHARSVDSRSDRSQSRVRALGHSVGWQLPSGWRICGENLQAVHSVEYKGLPSHFLVYAMVNETGVVLSWDETEDWCTKLNLSTVPVLYKGEYDAKKISACWTGRSTANGEQEGYVVRPEQEFPLAAYPFLVGKFVRKGHVQTKDHHWKTGRMTENQVVATKAEREL